MSSPSNRVGNATHALIGFIKEEIVRGKDGAEVSRTYYERNGWRDHGQARFYDSPEALMLHKVQAQERLHEPGRPRKRHHRRRRVKMDLDVGNAGRMKRSRDVAPTHLDRLLLAFPEIA